MTSAHVSWNQICAEDLEYFRRVKNRAYMRGQETAEKSLRTQAAYRERRRRRINVQFDGDVRSFYDASEGPNL